MRKMVARDKRDDEMLRFRAFMLMYAARGMHPGDARREAEKDVREGRVPTGEWLDKARRPSER